MRVLLTWTRTDTSQCEVTEAVGWMVEIAPWKRGQNMLRHEGDYLVVVAQKHQKDCAGSMRKVVRLGEQV